MKVSGVIKGFKEDPKKYIFTIVLGIIVIILGIASYRMGKNRNGVDYKSVLEETAVTVNGNKLSFKDVAFYVAYEESEVEEQAKVYDSSDTNKYWNLHIDGEFIRVAARNAAIQMAIHDEIFYEMACKEGIELTDDEKETLRLSQEDFWSDLKDYDKKERLGVDKDDIYSQMEKIAMSEKYQEIYAGLSNLSRDDFSFTSDEYKKLLEENKYSINEDTWSHIEFGSITLDH